MPREGKRLIEAEDLYRFQLITDCQISPEGRNIIFCVQSNDQVNEQRYTNLWIISSEGGVARQLTHGGYKDCHPRWSPDGQEIAFLSNRDASSQQQIYLIPLSGGEARRVSNLSGVFGSIEWSPDGRQLACQFRKMDEEVNTQEQDCRKKNPEDVVRHITQIHYKANGIGYLSKERWHIWVVDACSGIEEQLTEGDCYDEISPRWSPDGQDIVIVSKRGHAPDLEPHYSDLYLLPATGGTLRKVDAPFGPKYLPVFSPDGCWLAYIGNEGEGFGWKNDGLWVVPVDGGGPARNLTARYDIDITHLTTSDMISPLPSAPAWSTDGQRLYFQSVEHGRRLLKSISLAGDKLETVVGDDGVVSAFGFDRKQSKLAYFLGEISDPGQVWVRDMVNGYGQKLTHLNENLLNELDLGEIEEIWFKGREDNDLHGWILKPPDFDLDKTYPSILQIHGGPEDQCGHLFNFEFYELAAHGYVVYYSNPRGSAGYGQAHMSLIADGRGVVDYNDIMAWVDCVEQQPYIDKTRMGVAGGSYGGWMTNWIIGHTDRFKAAVTMRSVCNHISMWGNSDMNWRVQQAFGNQAPWENIERWWELAPLKYVGNVKTPTLIIHSQEDLRCPIDQAEQLFVALKRRGVETELVIFPEENHGLKLAGRTDRRIVRLRHIRRWFDRFLG